MKNLDEMYQEVMADEALKEEFIAALRDGMGASAQCDARVGAAQAGLRGLDAHSVGGHVDTRTSIKGYRAYNRMTERLSDSFVSKNGVSHEGNCQGRCRPLAFRAAGVRRYGVGRFCRVWRFDGWQR